ncbi:MAG: aspartate kinase [Thaumarchaeota archaeon]|nr:aspartate kinase [Nitrososphaerota archaeon]
MKFGGSSVADGAKIDHVAELVKQHLKGNQVAVVSSALDGVTDQLLELADLSLKGKTSQVKDELEKIKKRHSEAAEAAIPIEAFKHGVLSTVSTLLYELERVLSGISILRELSPRSKDYVLSFGERLLVTILRGALQARGAASRDFSGGEAGIVSDENFGDAKPLMNVTKMQVQKRLMPLLEEGILPVVAGFTAVTQHGDITTLGRGGSDNTATILGACLDADEVWIWTDVDGIMTADPKVVKNAKVIPRLSYAEASEMTVFGAKAMHPRALEPILEPRIPVRIKNTFSTSAEGTLIGGDQEASSGSIAKAVARVSDVGIVSVGGTSMVGLPGTAGRIFDALGKQGVNILMISQSVSESNITMVVRRNSVQKAVNALEIGLLSKGEVREVSYEDDVNIIALIGSAMRGTHGVAARVFKAVADRGINVIMIAQGSSELNISFAVRGKDGVEAVKALHDEFKLGA